jgi:hypothetical protein
VSELLERYKKCQISHLGQLSCFKLLTKLYEGLDELTITSIGICRFSGDSIGSQLIIFSIAAGHR